MHMLALFNTLHPSDCIDLYALPLENLLLILFFFFHQSNFCLSHLPYLKKVPFFYHLFRRRRLLLFFTGGNKISRFKKYS